MQLFKNCYVSNALSLSLSESGQGRVCILITLILHFNCILMSREIKEACMSLISVLFSAERGETVLSPFSSSILVSFVLIRP